MPVAIIILAAVLIAAGIRGTYKDLGALVVGDFTGQNNFFTWIIAIGCVGCLGYVPQFQRFSRVFLALILVAMFVKQGSGVFPQFVAALQGASPGAAKTPPGQRVTTDAPAASGSTDQSAGSGLLGGAGGIGSAVGSALGIDKLVPNITSAGGLISSIGKAFKSSDVGAAVNAPQ